MSTSSIPLFGRAYTLTVTSSSGTQTEISHNEWEPEALKIAFDITESVLPSPMWTANVTVWNLNDVTALDVLYNATWLTLSAGYQTGPTVASIIWDGPVLQVLFDRENVVDQKITFNCVASVSLLNQAFVNFSQGPFSSQLQVVQRMITGLNGNASEQISPTAQQLLAAKQYPRGKTVFGMAAKQISDIAADNRLGNWVSSGGSSLGATAQPNLSELDAGTKTVPDLIFGPPNPPGYRQSGQQDQSVTYSVIGVPKQFAAGVIFTVLLDPRLKVQVPPMLVQLTRSTVISQAKVQLGSLLTPLDQNLQFIAAQIRHYGDTRSNDWYTEVTGYNRKYAQGFLNADYLAYTTASK